MEDALTARNNASESVKNASEVKQAVLDSKMIQKQIIPYVLQMILN